MDVLDGLLFINEKDVWLAYGAFLMEENKDGHTNYSALLKAPAVKSYTAVSFREEHGEKLPDQLLPVWEARDVTLTFMIIGESKADFITKYDAFLSMLLSGMQVFYLPELKKTYKLVYQSCTEYTQHTSLNNNIVAGSFKVKFREPVPGDLNSI